jgi:DNA-binding NtrC family response regulator
LRCFFQDNGQMIGPDEHVRALIIDAEEVQRKGMALALQGYFSEIDVSDNPLNAAQLIRQRHYHVIISDISFQTADGVQAVQLFRYLAPEAVLIIVSGYLHKPVERRLREMDLHSIWEKPIDLGEFKRQIERIVYHEKE